MSKEDAMQAYINEMKKVMETAPYDTDLAQEINSLVS